MSSAAKAECGIHFINAHKAVKVRQLPEKMGPLQPPMLIQTDTSTVEGIVNSSVQLKCTKFMNLHAIKAMPRSSSDFPGAH